MSRPSLQLLKEKLDAVSGVKSREYFSFSLVKEGIPRSAIIELTGTAKASFICKFLAENPEAEVMWIQDKAMVFPPALAQKGVGLERLTLIDRNDHEFQNIRLAARSRTVPVIVAPSMFEEDALKRLKLFVEESKITLFLIAQELTSAYAITVQIQVDHCETDEAGMKLTIHKYKCEGRGCE